MNVTTFVHFFHFLAYAMDPQIVKDENRVNQASLTETIKCLMKPDEASQR